METYNIPGVASKTAVSRAFGPKYNEIAVLSDTDAKNLLTLASLTSGCADEPDPITATLAKLRNQLTQLEALAKSRNVGTLRLSLPDFIQAGRVYRNYVTSFKMLRTHLQTLGHHEADQQLKATFVERFVETMSTPSLEQFTKLYNHFVNGTLEENDVLPFAKMLGLTGDKAIDLTISSNRILPKDIAPIDPGRPVTEDDMQLLRQLLTPVPVDSAFVQSSFQRFNHRVEVSELTCQTFALVPLRLAEMLEDYVYILSARCRMLRYLQQPFESETNNFDDAVLIHASLGVKLPACFVGFRLEFGYKNDKQLVGPHGSVVPLQYPLSQEIWWPLLYLGFQTPEEIAPELGAVETMCKQIESLELREHVESLIVRCKRGLKIEPAPEENAADDARTTADNDLSLELDTGLLENGWD